MSDNHEERACEWRDETASHVCERRALLAEVAALRAERDAELRHCEALSANATAEARRADAAEAERTRLADALEAAKNEADIKARQLAGLRQRVEALAAKWDDERRYLDDRQEPIAAAYVELLRAALAADSPEPERPTCEHGRDVPHDYFEYGTAKERRCPGPAPSVASEPEEKP